jgi:hypothetical protein
MTNILNNFHGGLYLYLSKARVRKDDTTRNNPMLRTTTNARQS